MTNQPLKSRIGAMCEVDFVPPNVLDEMKIIHPQMKNKVVLNSFRELRTKLVHAAGKNNFSIMTTSICPGGGGSFVARNLAAAFALDQMKTALLVDCNLYEPSIEKVFGVDVDFGLTDYLAEESIDIEDVIYASGIPRLRVIPVGRYRESGTEHFTSEKMRDFVQELVIRYPDRYIIIDAPSVLTSADTHILAELCDHSLLVLPYGKVVESDVEEAMEVLSRTKFFGMVFNNN